MNTQTQERIAGLNDLARKYLCPPYCQTVLSQGVAELSETDRARVLQKVKGFNHFPEGDDPYKERDFGAFDHNGEKIFWKIDYYDKALENGSEDPADGSVTSRVLTIMLASEY